MGLYARYVLPWVVHYTCRSRPHMRQRAKIIPLAAGQVLEIGIGSGLNLPFYVSSRVTRVWGLDPSRESWSIAEQQRRRFEFEVEYVQGFAEDVPLDTDSVDSVVLTYTLCTLPDVGASLAEMRRVLRPDGQLIFCEHGAAPDERVRKWQDRLNPIWKRVGGGCNLNRHVPSLLEQGGFELRGLSSCYLPGWKPASFNYWGSAVPVRQTHPKGRGDSSP